MVGQREGQCDAGQVGVTEQGTESQEGSETDWV